MTPVASSSVAPPLTVPSSWHLRIETSPLDPIAALAGEDALIEAVATDVPATASVAPDDLSTTPRAIARLWRSRRCLVVPARQRADPAFAAAAADLARSGWPVVTRASGGSPVPLDPGVINLSLAFPIARERSPSWQIDDGFRLLTDTLIRAVAEFGLTVTCGQVAEAFCGGRFDLAIDGRKIAGTAQHWHAGHDAAGKKQQIVLAHAALLAAADLPAGIAAVNQWQSHFADRAICRLDRVTTLQRAFFPHVMPRERLIARLLAAILRSLPNPPATPAMEDPIIAAALPDFGQPEPAGGFGAFV